MMKEPLSNIRVRFAPSPTGPLHIGGVRTALYNYFFARRQGGTMILRIEDTDQQRFVPGAEAYIIESLRWAGINFDEGPDIGGPFGPYRQSDRKHLYSRYAEELVKKDLAYYAFDTPEELDTLRKRLEAEKAPNTSYCAAVRLEMRNSLSLSTEETRALLEEGIPYVIRFKMPAREDISVDDEIRGTVTVSSATLDDKVLFKSDGMPTYHLANIVDDHLMEVTHVIRGEEWLPSLPLHYMLYKAFGWEPPVFAHLPLLLKPDGQGKLSKRDGDRLGFPVFPLQWTDPFSGEISSGYRESGYYPEAFINFLALLGWNPGTEQEIFSMEELCESFSLERVGRSGARFDLDKARSFNQHYLRLRPDDELAGVLMQGLQERGITTNPDVAVKVVSLIRERAVFATDLLEQGLYFFEAPSVYDEKVVAKRWNEGTAGQMKALAELLDGIAPWQSNVLEGAVKEWIAAEGHNMGAVLNALRLCLVGTSAGPHLFDILDALGKEESLARIARAIARLV
jgi:glutamyl-tRNA synthetase